MTDNQTTVLRKNFLSYLMNEPGEIELLIDYLSENAKSQLFNRMKLKYLESLNKRNSNYKIDFE